jgi:hypothetical protein
MKATTGDGTAGEANQLRRSRLAPMCVLLMVLVILALLTRMVPISISPLPFNNDGLAESRIANDIVSSGHLDYPSGASYVETHSVLMPIYNVLLAFVSSSIGTSAFDVAQVTAGAVAVLTVTCMYLLALQITRGIRSAFASALVLGLLGTFVFLTESTWKASLGMALLVLLIFAYVNRVDRRFLTLEILILAVLPFVHHLATIMAFMAIMYLTIWSLFVGFVRNRLVVRHLIDFLIILSMSLAAYVYYVNGGLDRLSLVRSSLGLTYAVIALVAVCAAMIVVFSMKSHAKATFAPVVALLIFGILTYDYFHSFFSYVSSSPWFVLLLAGAVSALAGIAWYGLEKSVEQPSKYRAIPLCLLLPFLTTTGFAILSGMHFNNQQIVFRSFDFADVSLALGIGFAVASFKTARARASVVYAIVAALVVTLPFAYATQELTGVRHDTQRYEADAFGWLSTSAGANATVQSDERLSYIGDALYDIAKTPWLPQRLTDQNQLGVGGYFVFEDEWMTKGVNDFPNGNKVISSAWMSVLLESSNVLYLGGPSHDRIVVFEASETGWEVIQPLG